MPEPEILACYQAADGHVVDLWTIVGFETVLEVEVHLWSAGNDDRSVVVSGAATADDALDTYLKAIDFQRQVLAEDDTDPDELELTSAPAGADVFAGPDDFPPDGAAFRVGNMGAFRAACLRAAEGGELDLSGCDITPIPGDPS